MEQYTFFSKSLSAAEQRNPLLQLKQPEAGVGVARVKRRYKRKNAVSPAKKVPSPQKRHVTGKSPAKVPPPSVRSREVAAGLKVLSSSEECQRFPTGFNSNFSLF